MSGIYCILAKWPVPGVVKTRLAADVGADAACALAKAFLDDTLCSLAQDGVEMALALDNPELATSITLPVQLRSQGAGDLGARIQRVLSAALEEHEWAIAFGTDSPTLPVSRRLSAIAHCHVKLAQTLSSAPPATEVTSSGSIVSRSATGHRRTPMSPDCRCCQNSIRRGSSGASYPVGTLIRCRRRSRAYRKSA